MSFCFLLPLVQKSIPVLSKIFTDARHFDHAVMGIQVVQPVYFYKTLLTYSAVYLPCHSHNGGLVRIAFKIENLTVQSQDIGQVCQHCTVIYTPMCSDIVME